MEFIPHEYQRLSIDRMLTQANIALLLSPGLGKSVITLSVIRQLKLKTLIIAPLDVCYRVWPKEINKWDHTRGIKYTILHGPDKEKNFLTNQGIYIINPDGLQWLVRMVMKHRRWVFDALVVDESTTFKGHKSKRLEILSQILCNFKRRFILTGTPLTSSYLDLWGQYYLLDEGRRLYDNYNQYKRKYFYQADRQGYDWQLFPGADVQIQEKVADITIRIDGRDHLDLPDIIVNDIEVILDQTARKIYNDMKKEMLVSLDNNQVITAANAAVKSGKLQCITNGFLYISAMDPNTGKNRIVDTLDIHDHKIEALTSLVNELQGSPLLVGYHFKHDLIKLLRAFPGTPHFSTGATQVEKLRIEKDWNDGKLPLLFAQIHATARGLNLQESGYNICYYGLTWSFEDYTQFILRIARQGQKSKHVFVHRLIGKSTIDELMMTVIENRGEMSESFLNAFRKHLRDVST